MKKKFQRTFTILYSRNCNNPHFYYRNESLGYLEIDAIADLGFKHGKNRVIIEIIKTGQYVIRRPYNTAFFSIKLAKRSKDGRRHLFAICSRIFVPMFGNVPTGTRFNLTIKKI